MVTRDWWTAPVQAGPVTNHESPVAVPWIAHGTERPHHRRTTAHGDMNTPETSPSGNVHGMPLAAIMGYGAAELVDLMGFKPKAEPGNIVIVGARDLDAQERKIVKKSGIHVFTMRDIDERGMREVRADALKYAMEDTAGIAVSLDMDFVDPSDG